MRKFVILTPGESRITSCRNLQVTFSVVILYTTTQNLLYLIDEISYMFTRFDNQKCWLCVFYRNRGAIGNRNDKKVNIFMVKYSIKY